MMLSRRLEDGDDAALGGAVRPPPRADRAAAAQLLGDGLEHLLHLGWQARQHVDVVEHEPGRSSQRVLERARAGREQRPARDVLRVAAETAAEPLGHLRLFLPRHAEGGRDGLPGDVVGGASEPAGDDDDVGLLRLRAHQRRHPLLVVGKRRDQEDVEAERLEPAREPGAVGVGDVSRDELVPDRDDRAGRHRASMPQRPTSLGATQRPAPSGDLVSHRDDYSSSSRCSAAPTSSTAESTSATDFGHSQPERHTSVSSRHLNELQQRRVYACRLSPDHALESVVEAEAFVRERGVVTLTPSSSLPSLYGACHEQPYIPGGKGFGAYPRTKWPWGWELRERPGIHWLRLLRGTGVFHTDAVAAHADPLCREELARAE